MLTLFQLIFVVIIQWSVPVIRLSLPVWWYIASSQLQLQSLRFACLLMRIIQGGPSPLPARL